MEHPWGLAAAVPCVARGGEGMPPSKVHWQAACPAKTCSLHGAEPCAGCPPRLSLQGCAGCPPVMAQVGAQCTSTHPAGELPPSPGVPGQGARWQWGLGQGDGSWVLLQPGEPRGRGDPDPPPPWWQTWGWPSACPFPWGSWGVAGAQGQSSQIARAQHCCPRASTLPPELRQVVAFSGEKWGDRMGWGFPRCKVSPEHLALGHGTAVQTGAGLEPGLVTVQRRESGATGSAQGAQAGQEADAPEVAP